ncbi:MAG: hypothetical protein IBJ11_05920 [Phycisphaerales bacterium]|nr:hypothetical protein [Phycisphaerales bacterium]
MPNPQPTISHDRHAGRATRGFPGGRGVRGVRGVRGFTLAELLVALAATILLTVGISQIFRSVSKLVGTGTAIAEVDQLARAIEKQMRQDFQALNNMRADETFLAIRNRTIGDANNNGQLDAGEIDLYLTAADREADTRDGLAPYQRDSGGRPLSRAVSARLDEIVFLAFGGDRSPFESYQQAGYEDSPAIAQVARIYYGHGLRPQPDPAFDPTLPIDYENTPPRTGYTAPPARQYLPDGTNNAGFGLGYFGTPINSSSGRNRFAGGFPLARQALLLYGGLAAGYQGVSEGRLPPLGTRRTFAPYIRGLEFASFFRGWSSFDAVFRSAGDDSAASYVSTIQPNLPVPRSIHGGRTDICAQSPETVRHWLEGMTPDPPSAATPDSTPFDSGLLDEPGSSSLRPNDGRDTALWQRVAASAGGLSPDQARIQNFGRLQTAIAGVFTRLLVETEPPAVFRQSAQMQVQNSGNQRPWPLAEDALMDLHATLASRCSNLQISWSDGTTWVGRNARDTLTVTNAAGERFLLSPGDVAWFDSAMTRADFYAAANGQNPQQYPWPPPANELQAEILPGQRTSRLNVSTGQQTSSPGDTVPLYSEIATGGLPGEYLAIFPYREPGPDGVYVKAFPKPRLVRIRMTLHDSQFRIPGGKTFEFVFSVNLQ